MTAKEAFEKLGYVQKLYKNESNPYSDGIQYIKRDKDSEMDRVGMISTKYIEFYYLHKELLIYNKYEHRDGKTTNSDSGALSLEEFNAVQKQIQELQWQTHS
ncbi:hypothetical protein CVD28_00895 [Bacillus sp. M6-12]|uniref:hypothetical protein n=1 Tax=Bacillus sp. M6-12 TaxID=2054166 RepID=UPI000C77458F|nr:hypothetical protein [Bacillus sp. M6-12]PLS18990.1 hypothetical protein CVD28_00895 [Bacillus sp. M6-12]